VAQGGWKEGSQTRYDRFDLRRDIFSLSARMVDAPPHPATMGAEVISPPVGPVVRRPAAAPTPSPVESDDSSGDDGAMEEDERDAAADAAEPAHVGLARRLAEAAANSPPVRAVTRLMSRSSSTDQ
jgi:hypothetical protein